MRPYRIAKGQDNIQTTLLQGNAKIPIVHFLDSQGNIGVGFASALE
jgi:hypothetical protein